MRNTRRVAVLLTAACLALGASAEVTPVPPGSTAGLPPGTTPPLTPVAPRPVASTNPALPPRPLTINVSVKTSPTPDKDLVDKYVRDSVVRLMSDDPKIVSDSRADLIAAVTSPNPATPCTAIYLNEYVAALVAQIQPVLAKASLSQRLNIAIVVARVSQNVNLANTGASLQPFHDVILAELSDKSDAVAVWGMKSVAELLSPNQGGNLPAKIQNAIVPCIQSHGLSGPLTEEAYRSLNAGSAAFNIDATMQILKLRIGGYANGAIPPDPSVDRFASSHLTLSSMWNKMSKPQQAQVMDLIRRNMEAANAAIVSATSPEIVRDLRLLLTKDAAAVEVQTNDPAMSTLHFDARTLREHGDSYPLAQLSEATKKVTDGIPSAFPGGTAVAKP